MIKTLFLMAGCAAVALAGTITSTTDPGNTPGDVFDIAQGTVVNSNSPLMDGLDVRDLFGGAFGIGNESGNVIFSNTNSNPWSGSNNSLDYFVTFTTSSPINLAGYTLYLADDMNDTSNRTVTRFRLFASGDSTPISDVTILNPGQTDYNAAYGSDLVAVSDSFSAVSANTFTAVFSANSSATSDAIGPRVLELDGFSGVSAQGAVPEPGSLTLLSAGLLGLLLTREWNRFRRAAKR